MRPHRWQGGEGLVSWILGLAVVAVVTVVCLQVIPAKMKSSQLYDFMVEQAQVAAKAKPDAIKQNIMRKGKELGLPLKKNSVKVTKGGGRIIMKAKYTMVLEFPGYTYNWEVDQQVDRPIFLF